MTSLRQANKVVRAATRSMLCARGPHIVRRKTSLLNNFLQKRSMSSQFPTPPPQAARESSGAGWLLGGVSAIGLVYYVYTRHILEPRIEEHSMTLDEYEKWREQQTKKYGNSLLIKMDPEIKSKDIEEEAKLLRTKTEPLPPPKEDIPIPKRDVSPQEMYDSLLKVLADTREFEAQFKNDIKGKRSLSDEEKEQIQMYRDEKARVKKEINFVKKQLK